MDKRDLCLWNQGSGGGGGGGSLPDYNAGDMGKVLTVTGTPGSSTTFFAQQQVTTDEDGVATIANANVNAFQAGCEVTLTVGEDTFTETVQVDPTYGDIYADFDDGYFSLRVPAVEPGQTPPLIFIGDQETTYTVSASVAVIEPSATWQTPSGITFVDFQSSYGSVTDVSISAAQAWAIKDNSLLVIRTVGSFFYPYRIGSLRYSDNDPVGHCYSFLAAGAVPDSDGQYANGYFIDLFLEDATQTAYWVANKNWAGRSTG